MTRWIVSTLAAFVTAFMVLGCSAPGVHSMSNLDYPLVDIQKGIKRSFPVPFKNISRDGRKYETYAFVRAGKKLIEARNELERAKAFIEIRGTSRPYTVDVNVLIEESTRPNSLQKDFKVVGYDEVVAKIFLARLRAYLLRSKKSLDLIDDVKPF